MATSPAGTETGPRPAPKPLPPFFNVPNSLTMGRLALAVIVFGLIAYGLYWSALAIFGLAALTDALDGYFARRLGQSTPIGRQLDPLVDKIIVCGAYIYLLTIPGDRTGLQPWMVTTIVVRELLIQGLRGLLEGGGKAFGAMTAGKLKTAAQCVSISMILALLGFEKPGPVGLLVRDLTTWSAVGLTVYSGLGYVVVAIPNIKGRATTPIP